MFPALTLPPWTITLVAVLLLFGLPITAVIARAFELTPDGLKRTTVEAAPATLGAKVRGVEAALLVAILVAVGISVVQLTRDEAPPAADASAPDTRTPPDSIAVMPFTSFSDDADSNYFVDGLTEELIDNLAHIPGLKISGRTSSCYFKNRNEDRREIGRALGVDELRAAHLQGNRMLWDFDYFQRLDHMPPFATLRDDARFKAIIADIETDNRTMRERLLKRWPVGAISRSRFSRVSARPIAVGGPLLQAYARIRTGSSRMPWMKLDFRYTGSPTTSTFLKRLWISSQITRSCISPSRLPRQRWIPKPNDR